MVDFTGLGNFVDRGCSSREVFGNLKLNIEFNDKLRESLEKWKTNAIKITTYAAENIIKNPQNDIENNKKLLIYDKTLTAFSKIQSDIQFMQDSFLTDVRATPATQIFLPAHSRSPKIEDKDNGAGVFPVFRQI